MPRRNIQVDLSAATATGSVTCLFQSVPNEATSQVSDGRRHAIDLNLPAGRGTGRPTRHFDARPGRCTVDADAAWSIAGVVVARTIRPGRSTGSSC